MPSSSSSSCALLLPTFKPSPALLPRYKFSPPPRLSRLPRPVSALSSALSAVPAVAAKPSFAEVARTLVELSSAGTLSAVGPDGWPLAVGARFVADADGSPAVCLKNFASSSFSVGSRSSFHVQLEQSGLRTPQCTVLGTLDKPEPGLLVNDLQRKWERRFGEHLEERFLYMISVDRVLCLADFDEDGSLVDSTDYGNAEPDPLRSFAERIVEEMNSKHSEDVLRLSLAHIHTDFQVVDAKMIWVDRLGFDLYLYSEKEIFEARIPFPREITDEKGVKSTFNCMSHRAWEVEKNYALPESEKVGILKKVGSSA
ncbi:proton gradient regulation 7 [Wolffia australiana]